jgi:galactose mutarotase-like enzyme
MEITFGSATSWFTVSTRGGMLKSFVVDGTQVIYPEQDVDGKSRGGAFVCFPIFGSPPEGFKEFSQMSKHGFLRDQELAVVKRSNEGVTLFGTNEPSETFPWKLEYYVSTYFHGKKSIILGFQVKRLEDGLGWRMPFNMAFHPYFSSLGKSVAKIGRDIFMEFRSNSASVPINKSIIIEQGPSKRTIFMLGGFSDKSCFTLWSDNQEKYFCVEPVYCYPDLFGKAEGAFLEEGERKEMSCTIIRSCI